MSTQMLEVPGSAHLVDDATGQPFREIPHVSRPLNSVKAPNKGYELYSPLGEIPADLEHLTINKKEA